VADATTQLTPSSVVVGPSLITSRGAPAACFSVARSRTRKEPLATSAVSRTSRESGSAIVTRLAAVPGATVSAARLCPTSLLPGSSQPIATALATATAIT